MTIQRIQGPTNVATSYPTEGSPSAQADAAPAPLLPSPGAMSSDPMTMIAQLLVKSSQQKRQGDELTALAEEQAENAADAHRIEEMKDKANLTFAAGVGAGAAQIGAGSCSIAGGALSGTAAKGGSDVDLAKAKSISMNWDGASQATQGSGKIQEAIVKRFADGAEINIAKAESEAKVHKRAAEALHKEVDAAAQHEGKVMQLLQEIKQAQQQCEHAALLKMA